MSRIIQPEQLKPGDIILFVSEHKPKPTGLMNKLLWWVFELIGNCIRKSTNSKYTHAAICYDAETIAHAMKFWVPVRKDDIRQVLSSCKHAAVFRSSWAFGGNRVAKLQMFLDRIVDNGASYNMWAFLNFARRKESHLSTVRQRLEAHFNGQAAPDSFDKRAYFCSELPAACLCVIGAIEPSAAVFYHPSIISPADLGNDPTFGTFLGYLVPTEDTNIPEDDEFYHKELLPKEMGGI